MSYHKIIGASMFALGMAVAAPSMAANKDASATPSASEATAQTGVEAKTFSDEKLASYAAAHKKVDALDKEYNARAAGASDAAAKQQVQQLKNIELADAVQSEGLTTQEYNEIFMAAKADPALAAKIAGMNAPASETTTQ